MVEYEFELSEQSILDLTKKLKRNRSKFIEIKPKILTALAEYAKSRIEFYIETTTPQSTGDLINSFNISEIADDTISVYSNNEHALEVEYGTGIVGKTSSHPKASEINWKYDVNSHGKSGWWYYDRFGERHWTKGQVAHKYMLQAYKDLVREANNITRRVLQEEGLI